MAHYRFGRAAIDLDRVVGITPEPTSEAREETGGALLVHFEGTSAIRLEGTEAAALAAYVARLPDAAVVFEQGISGDEGPIARQR